MHRIALVILGLWVAFAPAVAVAPATAMTPHMSMPDDGGSGCCDGCPDMDRKLCAFICVNALPLAIAVDHNDLSAIGLHHDRGAGRHAALSDHCCSPDPPPPRSASLR